MAPAGATIRVGLYPRVSEDASGVARSPKEQEVELRDDADRRGWVVTVTEVDNDISASRYSTTVRPGWRRIIAAIHAGAFDILMVWEASRLTRDLEEYVELAKACRATGTRLYYGGNIFDLNDAEDEFRVVLDMGLAQRESGVTSKRIRRNVRANAEAGRPHGKRLFGYRRLRDEATGQLLGQEPDDVEAPIVREVFRRVADGATIWAVIAWLNATVRPPQADTVRKDGKPSSAKWSHPTVRRMLTNRSYLGHRTHRGEVVVENAWTALVDEDTFYRVEAILADPARRKSLDVTTVHLLAGLLRCACGSRCTYRFGRARNEAQYRCKDGGHVAADADRLEAGVRLLIAEALARPDALALFDPPEANLAGVRAEHKALLARLDGADDALAEGHLSPRAHGALERRLRPRIDELDARLRVAGRTVPTPVVRLAEALTADDVAARFDALDLTAQRLVVRTLLAECVLRPAPSNRRRPDLGLRFRWAGSGDFVDV